MSSVGGHASMVWARGGEEHRAEAAARQLWRGVPGRRSLLTHGSFGAVCLAAVRPTAMRNTLTPFSHPVLTHETSPGRYGFIYADLDVERAVQETAVSTFLGGCKHDIEVKGSCKHSGILSPNGCRCQCNPRWSGNRCQTCALQCDNGGIINDFNVMSGGRSVETCRCDCPEGFAGVQCEQTCPNTKPFVY